jgi:hypothetical protein
VTRKPVPRPKIQHHQSDSLTDSAQLLELFPQPISRPAPRQNYRQYSFQTSRFLFYILRRYL